MTTNDNTQATHIATPWNAMSPAGYHSAVYESHLLGPVYRAELEEIQTVADREAVLVEVGCGSGQFMFAAAHLFHSVVGVDISPSLLEDAARHARNKTAVTLIEGDAAQLRTVLRRSGFSPKFWRRPKVYCAVMNTLGIMPPSVRENVLRQIVSMLTPGDSFFFVTFNREYFVEAVQQFYSMNPGLCGYVTDEDVDVGTGELHVRSTGYASHWFSAAEVHELLHRLGYREFALKQIGVGLLAIGRLNRF